MKTKTPYQKFTKIAEAKSFLAERNIEFVLAQFVDIHGVAKTKAVPLAHFESLFSDGAGFAGFAVDGLGIQPHGPDFMAVGDLASLRLMPWAPDTARVACNGMVDRKPHAFDSRVICNRALEQLRSTLGMEFYSGLEPEFFLLRRDAAGNLQPAAESDRLAKPCYDYRAYNRSGPAVSEIATALRDAGIDVYQIDHEDAIGQFEINFTYSNGLETADNFIFAKMAAAEIAHKHGLICSFMPKPFSDRAGSGMHMHLSLGSAQKNAFHDAADTRGLELSQLAYWFLGGVLTHAKGLTAIACPSVNSYKRLTASGSMSGATWAPTSICYGDNNRTAMVRIPKGRLEIRVPDSSSNPYLLTAAVIAAGLDGVKRKLDPGAPTNENLYLMDESAKKKAGIETLPNNLLEALSALEADPVLVAGLGEDFAKEFVAIKRGEWQSYHRHVSDWELSKFLEFY